MSGPVLSGGRSGTRAQTTLLALAAALVILSATVVAGVAVIDGAFASADRTPDQRRAAVALADRLVAPSGTLTARRNVLDASALAGFDASHLDTEYPVTRGRSVRVRLGDRTLVETGDPAGGVTVRRIVLVEESRTASIVPSLRGRDTVTLPRRTDSLRIRVTPPGSTTVETVRANDRVVLHDPSGLSGWYDVRVSRFETATLRFEASGRLSQGDVTVEYEPTTTSKAVLAVTVDG